MQFILENPILIIVIIGMITSFMKKVKAQNQQNQEKPIPNKEFPKAHHLPKQHQHPKSNLGQEYSEMKRSIEHIQSKHEATFKESQSSNLPTKELEKNHTVEQVNLLVNKENVMNGIVWSQILSQPRSLKPYSTKRPTHRR